jgi:hypothetical protein
MKEKAKIFVEKKRDAGDFLRGCGCPLSRYTGGVERGFGVLVIGSCTLFLFVIYILNFYCLGCTRDILVSAYYLTIVLISKNILP